MSAGRPVIIIPAHDEARVIEDGLRALLSGPEAERFDVVVACNGCTDDTEGRAKAAAREAGRDVTVLSVPEASKPAAVRAAEELVDGFPRVYLDADVVCPTTTAIAMIDAVAAGAPVAVPARVIDTRSCSRAARAYYEAWTALPWVREQLAGRGAYAVARDLRETFGPFPDVVADDRWVTTRVPRAEAVIVDEPVIVRPARTLREVLAVRRRVYGGNRRLGAARHDRTRGERVGGLVRAVVNRPSLVPALLVFTATTVVAKALAMTDARRGRLAWGRATRPGAAAGRPPQHLPDDGGRADLDVVVVTYRSAGYARACVTSLDAALADVPGARIIVVDNGSDDDIASALAGASKRLDLVLRTTNDGFAGGCHAGAERSTARRLLFVNPDAVVRPDTVAALVGCAERHPAAGIIGGVARDDHGRRDERSWAGRPTLWSAVCFATGLSSAFPGSRLLDPESSQRHPERDQVAGMVSGGLMLVDRAAWDALGGFDRVFFLYGEDADLCVRAADAGWEVRVCVEANYRHAVGSSSAGSNRLPLVLRGRITTYRRNLPRPWGAVAGRLVMWGCGLRARTAGLRPDGGRQAIGRAAWQDAWRRRAEWRNGW